MAPTSTTVAVPDVSAIDDLIRRIEQRLELTPDGAPHLLVIPPETLAVSA